jgi:hypothetical protein
MLYASGKSIQSLKIATDWSALSDGDSSKPTQYAWHHSTTHLSMCKIWNRIVLLAHKKTSIQENVALFKGDSVPARFFKKSLVLLTGGC